MEGLRIIADRKGGQSAPAGAHLGPAERGAGAAD